jgi:hypothetical protein
MPYEVKELKKIALGTIRRIKYEVYDVNGADLTLSAASFRVRDSDGGTIVGGQSGVGNVVVLNNADVDRAGNTIKTVQMEIDFSNTEFAAGHYQLTFDVTFSTGETEKFKVPIEIEDFEEVS